MEGSADTPQSTDPQQPPAPPPRMPTRHTPLMASALQAARTGRLPWAPPPQGPQAPPGQQPPPPAPHHQVAGPGRPQDPLSVPFVLPSNGIYYPEYGHQSTIYLSPTRGAQEEVLAGAQGGKGAKLKVLIHVTRQCFQTGGIEFDRLLLEDWVAALLHFLSYSAGTDILALRPKHGKCDSFPVTKRLMELPLTTLRLVEDGEEPNWPPESSDDEELDEEMRILLEMEAEEKAALSAKGNAKNGDEPTVENVTRRVLRPIDAQEPFEAILSNDDRITWRHARLDDLVKAEEFSERIGSTQTQPGTKLHTFLLARLIVAINGRRMTPTPAYQWVKVAPQWLLDDLRAQINERSCGYDTAPRFRCKGCGVSFKVRLPLEGGLFRRPARKRR